MTEHNARWLAAMTVAVVTALALAVIPVAPAYAQQGGEPWTCVEVNPGVTLNLRSGPGVQYGVIATRRVGQQFDADWTRPQSADGYIWVPVRLPNGDEGWAITQRLDVCAGEAEQTIPTSAAVPESPHMSAVNDDGTLDRYEIAAVARSVVLLANVRGNRIRATGTGTITSPDGLIITNAHVVENADTIRVGILDDVNDPPAYRYLGEVVYRDEDVDVALIAIRSDLDGHPVRAADLDLPFISATLDADAVFRGDPVYIFGYPGIGNDFLVVTAGSIVSVENGDVQGQRLPVWYRTDAEIAPGSSGGLVVNGNGEFVGIPTFVEAEGLTGGRLGGIRPVQVALMAVMDGTGTVQEPLAAHAPDMLPVTIEQQVVQPRHGAVRFGENGIALDVMFTITGWQDHAAQVVARVYHDDLASAPLVNPDAPPQYRDAMGALRVVEPIRPCCAQTIYADDAALDLFLPYSALGLRTPGDYPLKIQVAVEAADGAWQSTLSWEFITVQAE